MNKLSFEEWTENDVCIEDEGKLFCDKLEFSELLDYIKILDFMGIS